MHIHLIMIRNLFCLQIAIEILLTCFLSKYLFNPDVLYRLEMIYDNIYNTLVNAILDYVIHTYSCTSSIGCSITFNGL